VFCDRIRSGGLYGEAIAVLDLAAAFATWSSRLALPRGFNPTLKVEVDVGKALILRERLGRSVKISEAWNIL
jgi:hypothetical protein